MAPEPRSSSRSRSAGVRSPQVLKAVVQLRDLILTGDLAPGVRLAELRLVATLGVSRTPLRLAFERLEHEGLLLRRPAGGFVVRDFTLREIRHAVELRGALEGMACRFNAELPKPNLGPLVALLSRIDELLNSPHPDSTLTARYAELNDQFHQTLVAAASNDLLRRLVDQVEALPFAFPSSLLLVRLTAHDALRRHVRAQAQHHEIVDAIAARDGARAEAIARDHARMALRNLDAAIKDRDNLDELPGGRLIRMP